MTEDYARPLELGDVVDLTVRLYRGNFLFFAGIYAVYAAVVLAVNLQVLGFEAYFKAHRPLLPYQACLGFAVIAVETLIVILMLGATLAAITRATAWACAGRKATIRDAYASVLPRLGRYIGLGVVLTLVIWGPVILAYAGYFGAVAHFVAHLGVHGGGAIPHALSRQGIMQLFLGAALMFLLLSCVGCAYAIVMGLRYALAFPVCVLEDLKVTQAMRRSTALSRRAWGRIFLFCLLVFGVKLLIVLPTQFFLLAAIFTHSPLGFGLRAFSKVLLFITGIILGPITYIGLTLFFYDQRLRWEGPMKSRKEASGAAAAAGEVSREPAPEAPAE